MRVEIEREIATKRWLIFVLRDGSPSWQWFPDVNGGPTWLEVEDGAPIQPSIKIDDEVWLPLTAALLGLPTDQRPLADHLNDAREVRDRLLAIIEDRVKRPKPEPVVIENRDGETGPWPGRTDG